MQSIAKGILAWHYAFFSSLPRSVLKSNCDGGTIIIMMALLLYRERLHHLLGFLSHSAKRGVSIPSSGSFHVTWYDLPTPSRDVGIFRMDVAASTLSGEF